LDRLKTILRWYLRFALLHSLFKIVKTYLTHQNIMRKLRSQLKGPKWDWTGQDVQKNMNRLVAWRADQMLTFKDEPMIVGAYSYPEVLISDWRFVKTILKDQFDKCAKPPPDMEQAFDLLGEFIGHDGIFCITHTNPHDALRWKFQRKLASRMFSVKIYKQIVDETFSPKVDLLCNVLDRIATQNDSISSNNKCEAAVIDMQEKFFSFTMDSIQEIFFHRKGVDTVSGAPDKFSTSYDDAHRLFMRFFLETIPHYLLARHVLPWPFGRLFLNSKRFNPGWELFKRFNGTYRKFEKARNFLHSETRKLVESARKENLEGRNDLLSFFLKGSKGLNVDLSDEFLVQ